MASQAVWVDAPDIEGQTWLLKNNTIVTTPALERTATNKRIRVKGTTASMGIRQLDALLDTAIKQVAANQGTEPWLRIWPDDKERDTAARDNSTEVKVWKQALTLHLLQNRDGNRNTGRTTSVVWTFRARGVPLLAYVWVELRQNYHDQYSVVTKVQYRSTHPADGDGTQYLSHENGSWNRYAWQVQYYSPQYRAIERFVDATDTPFVGEKDQLPVTELRGFGISARRAVAHLAQTCAKVNRISELTLPDLRDPDNPAWLTYDFEGTNFSGSFAQELTDFVQTGPILDRIRERYTELLADLQLLGVVLDKRPEEEAFQRVVNGDFTGLTVSILPNQEHDEYDHHHRVHLNLPTGTIHVSCTGPSERADALAQWQIDKFRLEATGELSEFLAYAQAFTEKLDRKTAKKVSDSRAFNPDDLTT